MCGLPRQHHPVRRMHGRSRTLTLFCAPPLHCRWPLASSVLVGALCGGVDLGWGSALCSGAPDRSTASLRKQTELPANLSTRSRERGVFVWLPLLWIYIVLDLLWLVSPPMCCLFRLHPACCSSARVREFSHHSPIITPDRSVSVFHREMHFRRSLRFAHTHHMRHTTHLLLWSTKFKTPSKKLAHIDCLKWCSLSLLFIQSNGSQKSRT